MNSLNRLGLTAALVTALLLVVVFGAWWGIRAFFNSSPESTQDTLMADAEASRDSDGDGLPDLVENLYKTSPEQADSDQDGVSDGEEVRLGQNPTLADAAAFGGLLPLGSQVVERDTWTKKYLASLPEDTPQDQILTDERLTAFVNANKGELLPPLPAGTITTSTASDSEAVKAYLDQVSPATNTKLHVVTIADIETAWRARYQEAQAQPMADLLAKLHENVKTLEAIAAPSSLTPLHTKMVAAAHALTNNTELLRDMDSDLVGGLIGAKNIEELNVVFQEIEAEVEKNR